MFVFISHEPFPVDVNCIDAERKDPAAFAGYPTA